MLTNEAKRFWRLLTLIIATGALLRVFVIYTFPNFYGPGDPAIYFTMGRSILQGNGPEVSFIWHYLTLSEIVHYEDYYEPAFGLLVAMTMFLTGGSVAGAKCLPLLFGLATIPAAAIITRRRAGVTAGLWAAVIVSFHPYSIYHSGLLMKETMVACLFLVFWDVCSRRLENFPASKTGFSTGVLIGGFGLLQYESLPVTCVALFTFLMLRNRRLVLPAGLGLSLIIVPLLACSWHFLGVPISAKFLFFFGHDLNTPGVADTFQWTKLLKLFPPIGYLVKQLFLVLEFPLYVFGAWQAWRWRRTDFGLLLILLVISRVYFHSIPKDLWHRDVMTLMPLLAVPASAGIASFHDWLVARTKLSPWKVSIVLIAALLGIFHTYVGYDQIYSNHQFPDYKDAQFRRYEACAQIREAQKRGVIPKGEPILADEMVEEIYLFSGHPAVRYPNDINLVPRLVKRYQLRYMLLPAFTPGYDWQKQLAGLTYKNVFRLAAGYVLVELEPLQNERIVPKK
ncbi:MAG: hypothetical protein O3B01_17620 [Planctomycetota bacterium]|nr:hypothetical protein [Planctomycetota bacterium]MDA1140394.1 hypothetical protein [Planctomycetota bacterium]